MARKAVPGSDCLPAAGTHVLGCVAEIDMRTNVGTAAWQASHVPRIRKLSALRRAHQLRTHSGVKRELTRRGYDRAVEVPPKEFVDIVKTFEARDAVKSKKS